MISFYLRTMKKQKQILKEENTIGTEQKIIAAAIKIFQAKGFAATRTRDIAEEAGMNLALLNYYFRSKQKLFEIVMLHSMGEFMKALTLLMNDEDTSIEAKIAAIVNAYHEMLKEKPSFPLFILNELGHGNHTVLLKATGLKKIYQKSVFALQYQAEVDRGRFAPRPLIWLVTNIMSLTIFPFMASPLLQMLGDLENKQYQLFLSQRKESVTQWILHTLKP